MRFVLRKGDIDLGLAPEEGGCVTHLTWQGRQVLRPVLPATSARPFDARDFAAFPLIPFSGRIEKGRMQIGGKCIDLAPNMAPEPHAIHGHGWQTAWQVAHRSEDMACLNYSYEDGDWPWPYHAQQIFQLLPDGIVLRLELTNLGGSDMPAGIGWHPYFPRAHAHLSLPSQALWPSGKQGLDRAPIALTPRTQLQKMRRVSDLQLDNCYDVGEGPFHMLWPEYSVAIRPDPVFGKAIVYIPDAEPFFCVEPVSHAPNAVNAKLDAATTGLKWLRPRQTLSGTIHLQVTPIH